MIKRILKKFKSKINKLRSLFIQTFFGHYHLRTHFLEHQNKHEINLQNVKDKIKKQKKIKIVFLDIDFGLFHFSSLYEELKNYESIEPLLFVYSEIGNGEFDAEEARERYNKRVEAGFNSFLAYDNENNPIPIEATKPDIIFYSHYQTATDSVDNHYIRRAVSNTLSCLVAYYILSLKANVPKLFIHKNVISSWVQFLDNKHEHNLSLQNTVTNGTNTVVSGHLSRDIVDNSVIDKTLEKLKNKRKIIIYAPHWGPYAPFYKVANDILSLLKKYPDIGFVLKPHSALYLRTFNKNTPDKVTNGWRYSDWERYKNEWTESENGVMITESDSANLFSKCDILINESESYILGWASTEKPCIQFYQSCNSKKDPKITRFSYANDVANSYYVANTFSDVEKYLKALVIDNNDFKKEEREKVTKEFKIKEGSSSAKFIAKYLLEKLEIYKEEV